MMRPTPVLLILLLLLGSILAASAECPPKNFDSVKDFDIKKYVSAPWYIQEQVRGQKCTPAWQ
jgi:hypothetical protein